MPSGPVYVVLTTIWPSGPTGPETSLSMISPMAMSRTAVAPSGIGINGGRCPGSPSPQPVTTAMSRPALAMLARPEKGMGGASTAPISQTGRPSALPSLGRGAPRWSTVRGGQAASPASIAGLPGCSAWVAVGPPLFCRGPNTAVDTSAPLITRSPVPALGQPVPTPTRLWPNDVMPLGLQSIASAVVVVLPATMVWDNCTTPSD